jgi:hypothetical protein
LYHTVLSGTLTLLVGRLEDFAGHVRNKLEAFDWHQRRDLIRLLVKRVEIDHTDITVVFRVTPLPDGHDPDNSSRILQDCPGRQHFPAVPVHNRHQVEKPLGHRDVRDLPLRVAQGPGRPHLVLDGEAAQQVRIDLVLGVRLAGVGSLPDHLQAHLTHQPRLRLTTWPSRRSQAVILRER